MKTSAQKNLMADLHIGAMFDCSYYVPMLPNFKKKAVYKSHTSCKGIIEGQECGLE